MTATIAAWSQLLATNVLGSNFLHSDGFVLQLASSAVRTLLIAAAAGLAIALMRVRSTSLRLFIWTAVLLAGLAMPLLTGSLPGLPLPVPSRLQSVSNVWTHAPATHE